MFHTDDAAAFPSQATLARQLTRTDRGVRAVVDRLTAPGVLKTVRRGRNRTNLYEVDYGKLAELTPAAVAETVGRRAAARRGKADRNRGSAPTDRNRGSSHDRNPSSAPDRNPGSAPDRNPGSGRTRREHPARTQT